MAMHLGVFPDLARRISYSYLLSTKNLLTDCTEYSSTISARLPGPLFSLGGEHAL